MPEQILLTEFHWSTHLWHNTQSVCYLHRILWYFSMAYTYTHIIHSSTWCILILLLIHDGLDRFRQFKYTSANTFYHWNSLNITQTFTQPGILLIVWFMWYVNPAMFNSGNGSVFQQIQIYLLHGLTADRMALNVFCYNGVKWWDDCLIWVSRLTFKFCLCSSVQWITWLYHNDTKLYFVALCVIAIGMAFALNLNTLRAINKSTISQSIIDCSNI